MKWALARLVNNQNGRGFVSWDAYREFKTAEKSEFSLGTSHRRLIRSSPPL